MGLNGLTVRHRKKGFDDAILRPYGATKRICDNYFGDECEIAIVSGACLSRSCGRDEVIPPTSGDIPRIFPLFVCSTHKLDCFLFS